MSGSKTPVFVKDIEMAVELSTGFGKDKCVELGFLEMRFNQFIRVCPIFQVSNVTGEGLDFVCHLIVHLPIF
jgi:GTPase